MPIYRGRFAPSPTGLLHLGSLAAALASWLDARANNGKWLIRIEDIDPPRERPGAAAAQLETLARYGFESDEPVMFQSGRGDAYRQALQVLEQRGATYVCRCTRAQRASAASKNAGPAYPGTCRDRGWSLPGAIRLRVDPGVVRIEDRALGPFEQDVAREVGDFILRRADGWWAYQLAVVVDDDHQRITDIVRGADLLDNTPRQVLLQRALGLHAPRTLHIPLLRDAQGRKVSKSAQAPAVGGTERLDELEQAWQHLGFVRIGARDSAAFLRHAVEAWGRRWPPGRAPA